LSSSSKDTKDSNVLCCFTDINFQYNKYLRCSRRTRLIPELKICKYGTKYVNLREAMKRNKLRQK